MKAIKFEAIISVAARDTWGFEASVVERSGTIPGTIGITWKRAAEAVKTESGIYVSATLTESKGLYETDRGGTLIGALAYTIAGSLNPRFDEPDAWRHAVIETVKRVKNALNLSTVTVEFFEVDQVCLED